MNMEQKSSFITIIGRPNVGKSSLMNRVLGQKVAIVSNKPQTTRTKIMGIYTKDEVQTVFIDTPGFHKPRNELDKNMNKAVGAGMADVDAAILVVEAVTKFKSEQGVLPPAEAELIGELKKRKLPALLVINKIDLLSDKQQLFPIINQYCEAFPFSGVIPLSARTGDGIDGMLSEIGQFAKPSPHYFGDEDVTDQPEKVMVAEMIREKLLRSLDKEVPHGIAVDLEKFVERDTSAGEPIVEVEATIICEKESHKGIIIGRQGAMLKKIGSDARRDIERFFGIKANVKLWVKVKEDWRNRQGLIHTFGLD